MVRSVAMRLYALAFAALFACGGAPSPASAPAAPASAPAAPAATTMPTVTVDEAVRDAMRGNEQLSPIFFEGGALRPEVAKKAREVGEEMFRAANVPDGRLADILFAGSLASYEYTRDSDADLHLVVESSTPDPKLFVAYLRALSTTLHQDTGMRFLGVPMQITLVATPDAQGGAWSVVKGAWAHRPERRPVRFAEAELRAAVDGFARARDLEIAEYRRAPATFDCARLAKLRSELKDARGKGLASEAGVVSLGNMSYRVVRRLGWFDEVERVHAQCLDARRSLVRP